MAYVSVLPISTNSSWPPSNRKCLPPLKSSYLFFLSHQDVLCDLQHISKHAYESVVNRTWRHSSLRKSMCRVQSRMIIVQNVFLVELKNSGSQKQIFLLIRLFEQQFFSLTGYCKLLSIAPCLGTFLYSFLSPSHSKPESSLEVFV